MQGVLDLIMNKVLKKRWFTISLIVMTFLFWIFANKNAHKMSGITVAGYITLASILALILIFYEDTFYIIPVIICIFFVMGSDQTLLNNNTFKEQPLLFIALGIVVIGFAIHFIRYKVKLKLGALSVGLILIAIGYILPFSLSDKPEIVNNEFAFTGTMVSITEVLYIYILASLMGFLYFFVYVFLGSTVKDLSASRLIPVLFGMGILITCQFLAEYIRIINYQLLDGKSILEAILWGIDNKWGQYNGAVGITLGWGVHNDGAMMMSFFLPTIVYYMLKKPKNLIFILIFFLEVGVIVLSASRGAYLAAGIVILMSFPLLILKANRQTKLKLLFLLLGVMLFLGIRIEIGRQIVNQFFELATSLESFFNGRFPLYRLAIQEFLEHPIVGGSWYALVDSSSRIIVFHSTFFQVIGTMGLFGLFALIFHFIEVIKLVIKKVSFPVWFLLIGMIATQIHGLVDNTFYTPFYTIITIMIYVVIERNNKEEKSLNLAYSQL